MPTHVTSPEAQHGRVVLVDPSTPYTAPGAYKGLHALVPILIGLMLPILLFSMFDPRALGSTRLVAHLFLFGVCIFATVLFVLTVFNPGNIVQVEADPKSRTVALVQSGAFANRVTSVRFHEIAAVRSETRYDDDGYQQRVAVMVLDNRETIELPAGASEADLAALRAVIGLR